MALYLIGDIQGCHGALTGLLTQLDASPSRDHLVVLGDLLNRGPDNLGVLTTLQHWGSSATCLLGNHDLHALAVYAGVRPLHRLDTLSDVLSSPNAEKHVQWLRQRPLAHWAHGWLMVHAGVLPQWTTAATLGHAKAVQDQLQAPDWQDWLRTMYGNEPARWDATLPHHDRLRLTVNALTRSRFCYADGTLDFKVKENADDAPDGLMPWFKVPSRLTADQPIAFGHWSTLGLVNEPHLLALDTGCVWGGALSAASLVPQAMGAARVSQLTQQRCPQAQVPQMP